MNFSQEEIDAELKRRESTPQQAGAFSQDEIAAELARREGSAPQQPVSYSGPNRFGPIPEGLAEGFGNFLQGGVQGVRNVGQEVGKFLHKSGEFTRGVSPEETASFTQGVDEQRASFSETDAGQTKSGKAGEFSGELGTLMAVPSSAPGLVTSFLGKLVASGGLGAVAGSLAPVSEAEEASGTRTMNIILGSGFGIAGQTIKPVIGATTDVWSMFTKRGGKNVYEDTLSALIAKSDLKASDDAAKGVGTFLTPAERTNIPMIRSMESQIDVPRDVALNLQVQLLKRQKVVTKSVEKLVQDIAPEDPKRAEIISEGYAALSRTRVKPEFMDKILEDPVLGKQWKKMLKNEDYAIELDKLPVGSAARLDTFQKFLREKTETLFSSTKGTRKTAARNTRLARKEMMDVLDTNLPDYAVARRESQLNIMREMFDDGLAKTKAGRGAVAGEGGVKHPTAVQFYQKFLKADDVFDDLINNLEDMPEAQKKATQLRIVLGAMEDTPIEKALDQSASVAFGGTAGQGTMGVVAQKGLLKLRERYYEGMVEFITDPNLSSVLLDESADIASKGQIHKKEVQTVIDALVDVVTRSQTLAHSNELALPNED